METTNGGDEMLKWKKEENGWYSAEIDGNTFEVVYVSTKDSDTGRHWNCYFNSRLFDACQTRKEAVDCCNRSWEQMKAAN
jgi:hypothetical protein